MLLYLDITTDLKENGFKEADRGVNSILHHVRSCELRKLGTKTTRQAQKQLDEPKYHSASPRGI